MVEPWSSKPLMGVQFLLSLLISYIFSFLLLLKIFLKNFIMITNLKSIFYIFIFIIYTNTLIYILPMLYLTYIMTRPLLEDNLYINIYELTPIFHNFIFLLIIIIFISCSINLTKISKLNFINGCKLKLLITILMLLLLQGINWISWNFKISELWVLSDLIEITLISVLLILILRLHLYWLISNYYWIAILQLFLAYILPVNLLQFFIFTNIHKIFTWELVFSLSFLYIFIFYSNYFTKEVANKFTFYSRKYLISRTLFINFICFFITCIFLISSSIIKITDISSEFIFYDLWIILVILWYDLETIVNISLWNLIIFLIMFYLNFCNKLIMVIILFIWVISIKFNKIFHLICLFHIFLIIYPINVWKILYFFILNNIFLLYITCFLLIYFCYLS